MSIKFLTETMEIDTLDELATLVKSLEWGCDDRDYDLYPWTIEDYERTIESAVYMIKHSIDPDDPQYTMSREEYSSLYSELKLLFKKLDIWDNEYIIPEYE